MAQACETAYGSLLVPPDKVPDPAFDPPPAAEETEQTAVLAGGCFWCVEAVFRQVGGVHEAVSGYAGGTAETANYESVCSAATGHAEVVLIRFDPRQISYGQILKIFLSAAHDPTQRDRQGADVGPQYRSAIFVADDRQQEIAERYLAQLAEAGVFSAPLATRVEPLAEFFAAEEYHQDYASRHPGQPYIALTSRPKVDKVRKYFSGRVK